MKQITCAKESAEFLSILKSIKKKDDIFPEDLPGYGEYLANNLARFFKKEIKRNPSGSKVNKRY